MGSVWFQHESSELVCTLWCLEMWTGRQTSPYCVFYKSKVCANPESSKTISTIFPAVFDHFVSLCHASVIFPMYQTSSFLFCLLWWSVTSDLRCYCCNCLSRFLLVKIFIETELIYNVVLVSGVQQSNRHIYIYPFSDYFPLEIIRYWVEFPVLYSRSLLIIYLG